MCVDNFGVKRAVSCIVKMVKMSRDMKRRVSTVVWLAKTAFHWGFIPTVLYLGIVVLLERLNKAVAIRTAGRIKKPKAISRRCSDWSRLP